MLCRAGAGRLTAGAYAGEVLGLLHSSVASGVLAISNKVATHATSCVISSA